MKSSTIMGWLRRLFLVLVFLGLLGGAVWGTWVWQASGEKAPLFRTERVTRSRLVALINATGTVVPEEVVDVGAQVAGRIVAFGKDLDDSSRTIDYRSRVEEGTVLARIDDSLYAPEVDIAKADLAMAEAEVARLEAEQEALEAKLVQATRDYERARRLGNTSAIAQAEFDLINNTYLVAKAAVPAGRAALLKAQKTVDRARQVLQKAEKNLGYTTIVSPVKGVIIDRRVNIGQTVVASLNAPSLFLIAKDLKRMQVWASVNEADIGRIHAGQTVYFKVDAFPQDVFTGTVKQIRYNASMAQNVVTYTVVVDTDNEDLKLLPYLTANLQFRVDQRDDALLVPNAALRYRPSPQRVHPDYRSAYEQTLRRRATVTEYLPGSSQKRQTQGVVWVQEDEFVKPIKVQTGLTDGASTEILNVEEGTLDEGTLLVTGELQPQTQQSGTVNPFAPPLRGGKKKS